MSLVHKRGWGKAPQRSREHRRDAAGEDEELHELALCQELGRLRDLPGLCDDTALRS